MQIKGIIIFMCVFFYAVGLEGACHHKHHHHHLPNKKNMTTLSFVNMHSRSHQGIVPTFHFGPGPS